MSALPTRRERGLADLMVAIDAATNTMELREQQRDQAIVIARMWEDTAIALDVALTEATALIHALWEEELSYPTCLWDRMCAFLKANR